VKMGFDTELESLKAKIEEQDRYFKKMEATIKRYQKTNRDREELHKKLQGECLKLSLENEEIKEEVVNLKKGYLLFLLYIKAVQSVRLALARVI